MWRELHFRSLCSMCPPYAASSLCVHLVTWAAYDSGEADPGSGLEERGQERAALAWGQEGRILRLCIYQTRGEATVQ